MIGVNRLRVSIDGVTEQELLDQLNGYIYVYIYIYIYLLLLLLLLVGLKGMIFSVYLLEFKQSLPPERNIVIKQDFVNGLLKELNKK